MGGLRGLSQKCGLQAVASPDRKIFSPSSLTLRSPFIRPVDVRGMGSIFWKNFPRQLRLWTLHGLLNAAPSAAFAVAWLKLGTGPAGIPALAAVATAVYLFVLGGACLTSLPGPLSTPGHALHRALRHALTLRNCLVCLTLPLVLSQRTLFFIPDVWCGGIATLAFGAVCKALGLDPGPLDELSLIDFPHAGFFPIFSIALIEGLLLSLLLVILTTLVLLILQRRDRRIQR